MRARHQEIEKSVTKRRTSVELFFPNVQVQKKHSRLAIFSYASKTEILSQGS